MQLLVLPARGKQHREAVQAHPGVHMGPDTLTLLALWRWMRPTRPPDFCWSSYLCERHTTGGNMVAYTEPLTDLPSCSSAVVGKELLGPIIARSEL